MRKGGRLSAGDLSLLCTQLGMLLRAGVSLADGLQLLKTETSGRLPSAVGELAGSVRDRHSLSEAMELSGRFPDYLVRMTKTGEVSGNLEGVMESLAAFYQREDKLARQIREAAVYPLILLAMLGVSIGFIVTRVLPMFGGILADLGGELPGFARALMNAGLFVEGNALWFCLALLIIIFVIVVCAYSKRSRLFFGRPASRLPVVRKLAAARFSSAMGVLLSGGISMNTALELSGGLLKNTYLTEKLKKAVSGSQNAGEALANSGIFPEKFTKMFIVGCESGEADAAMLRLASIYEEETNRSLDRLTGSIEPVMSALLSILVGVILVSVILPLINIMAFIG